MSFHSLFFTSTLQTNLSVLTIWSLTTWRSIVTLSVRNNPWTSISHSTPHKGVLKCFFAQFQFSASTVQWAIAMSVHPKQTDKILNLQKKWPWNINQIFYFFNFQSSCFLLKAGFYRQTMIQWKRWSMSFYFIRHSDLMSFANTQKWRVDHYSSRNLSMNAKYQQLDNDYTTSVPHHNQIYTFLIHGVGHYVGAFFNTDWTSFGAFSHSGFHTVISSITLTTRESDVAYNCNTGGKNNHQKQWWNWV